MKISSPKIDWTNHLIGFFSALFGILIAFELEEWRQDRHDRREAREAFTKLKEEILINKNALHEAIATNQRLISILGAELLPAVDEALIFKGSLTQAQTLNAKWNPVAMIDIRDTTANQVKAPVNIFMNAFILPTLHYAAWESAKEAGIMNHLEYDKVLTISYTYTTPKITDELMEIRSLLRSASEVNSKSTLRKLLRELRECHTVMETELGNFDVFANMVQGME